MSGNPHPHDELSLEKHDQTHLEVPQDFTGWAPFLDLSQSIPDDLGEIILVDLLGNFSEQTGAQFG